MGKILTRALKAKQNKTNNTRDVGVEFPVLCLQQNVSSVDLFGERLIYYDVRSFLDTVTDRDNL